MTFLDGDPGEGSGLQLKPGLERLSVFNCGEQLSANIFCRNTEVLTVTLSSLMGTVMNLPLFSLRRWEAIHLEKAALGLSLVPFLPNNLYQTLMMIISLFTFMWPYPI